MRITPQIVWGRNLSDEDFYHAIKLQSSFTHSNPVVLEATYLYSWAIRRLIKDPDVTPSALYQETRDLCYERMIKGLTKANITDWFDEINKGQLPNATH